MVENPLAASPPVLRTSTERPDVTARLADDLFAVHGRPRGPAGKAILEFEGEEVAVFAGQPDPEQGYTVGPVYRDTPGGGVCVPTQRVLMRFAEGQALEKKRAEIEAAGFRIARVLGYARHCGWVTPESGTVADALRGIPVLERIPGVVNVEPQVLRERSAR